MKAKRRTRGDGMRPEYDFDYTKAARGQYYRRLLEEGANIAVLDPDIARAFRSSEAVNEALRSLLRMSAVMRDLTSTSRTRRSGSRR